MEIRDERPGDEDAIHVLTAEAFRPMPYSSGTEPAIIRALRASGALTLSLVAVEDGAIVGHVAFSPVAIDGAEGWFGLGPISVRADRQRQGIGRALIAEGLRRLAERGAHGCALIGDPAVYGGSGFTSGRLRYGDLDPRLVQHIVLKGETPSGEIRFAPAFDVGAGD